MTVAPEWIATSTVLQRKSGIGARRIFRRPLHVVGEVARARDRRADRFEHRVLAHLQLVLHVDGTGGDEGVDARPLGALERFAGARRCP